MMKRPAIIALVALVLLCALPFADPESRNYILCRREYRKERVIWSGYETHMIGYMTVSRITGHISGPSLFWETTSGQVLHDVIWRDGQMCIPREDPTRIPPTAPWILEGITADEWWALVKPDR